MKSLRRRYAMRRLWDTLLKGLAAVLPVTLTLYLVYWTVVFIERIFRDIITLILPDQFYLPGMGVAAGLVLLFLAGLAVDAWVVKRALRVGERVLEMIPLVKSVYAALRDFMEYFSSHKKHSGMKQVVMVEFAPDLRLLGFVTRENNNDNAGLTLPDDVIAVYFPMSYQIGGFTVYLPRAKAEPVAMSVEDAMRLVLTAGVSVVRDPANEVDAAASVAR